MLVSGRVITHVTQNVFFEFSYFTFQISQSHGAFNSKRIQSGSRLDGAPSLSRWFKHNILPWNLTIHTCKSVFSIYSIYSGFSIFSGFSRYLFISNNFIIHLFQDITCWRLPTHLKNLLLKLDHFPKYIAKHQKPPPKVILLAKNHTETPYSLCKQYTN